MTERRHKKAVRSARKCENLLDRQRGGNKNGYKWRKSVRCRLHRGSCQGRKILSYYDQKRPFRLQSALKGLFLILSYGFTGIIYINKL